VQPVACAVSVSTSTSSSAISNKENSTHRAPGCPPSQLSVALVAPQKQQLTSMQPATSAVKMSSSFEIFRRMETTALRLDNPFSTFSTALGDTVRQRWHNLSPDDRTKFYWLSEQEQQRFQTNPPTVYTAVVPVTKCGLMVSLSQPKEQEAIDGIYPILVSCRQLPGGRKGAAQFQGKSDQLLEINGAPCRTMPFDTVLGMLQSIVQKAQGQRLYVVLRMRHICTPENCQNHCKGSKTQTNLSSNGPSLNPIESKDSAVRARARTAAVGTVAPTPEPKTYEDGL
jgi:hypothetical protein